MSRRTKLILRIKAKVLSKQLKRNLRFMSMLAAENRKNEFRINEIILRDNKIVSELENIRKELRENE